MHGQESVIEGLRAERKLWGQELAQQGKEAVHPVGMATKRTFLPPDRFSISETVLYNSAI